MLDRIEALTKERDAAYASGYSDAEREISNTALGQSNTFLHSQLAMAKHRIEALTKQLAAARQDAKAAEDELEMQEQEACMMENDYIKLEKERDALEAKLAQAEAGLREIVGECGCFIARTTLAEIKAT
jgi:septal ring factor EnvC (AmiA/AmiB activator)